MPHMGKITDDIDEKHSHEIKMGKRCPWRLYDVQRNLREWTRDTYEAKLPGGLNPFMDSADHLMHLPMFRDSNLGFRPATIPFEPDK